MSCVELELELESAVTPIIEDLNKQTPKTETSKKETPKKQAQKNQEPNKQTPKKETVKIQAPMKQKQVKEADTNNDDDEKEEEKEEKVELKIKNGSLARLFFNDDYAPPIPFDWPLYIALKHCAPDVVQLIRSSCKQVTESCQYIDINYKHLKKYAASLNKKEINLAFNPNRWNENVNNKNKIMDNGLDFLNELNIFNERDLINISCYFCMLQFGSGFRKALHKYCGGRGVLITISIGIKNLFKNYPNLDVQSLSNLTIGEIAVLFEINDAKSPQLKSLCDMIRGCIAECVHVLEIKGFNDFADYIYHQIDKSWIKSQTKSLSRIETIEFVVNEKVELGLKLAPTKSDIVKRTVVIGFDPTDNVLFNVQNNFILQQLVKRRAFIYAINDEIIYNRPFNEIVAKINEMVLGRNLNQWNPHEYIVGDKRIVALQFGVGLEDEPDTVQSLLWNLINDFTSLNDQYLYRSLFKDGSHLKVYLYKRAQLIIMELFNNLSHTNPLFKFKNINSLTAMIDNVIPMILMTDNIISIKDQYKEEYDKHVNITNGHSYVLKACDLEVEIRASALCAIELILAKRRDISVVKLMHYLWKKRTFPQYKQSERHYTRDTVFY